jgi:hypothetical protein
VDDAFQVGVFEADDDAPYLAGNFKDAYAADLPGIRQWKDGAWLPLGSALEAGGNIAVMKSTPAGLFVAGGFTSIGGVPAKTRGAALPGPIGNAAGRDLPVPGGGRSRRTVHPRREGAPRRPPASPVAAKVDGLDALRAFCNPIEPADFPFSGK